jgi:hypothetical protein
MALDPGPMEEGRPWLGDPEIDFDADCMGWFPRWHPILLDGFNQIGAAPDHAPLPGGGTVVGGAPLHQESGEEGGREDGNALLTEPLALMTAGRAAGGTGSTPSDQAGAAGRPPPPQGSAPGARTH